ncbi:hypothetical protein [Streptomyces sp. NPDC016172]
MTTAETGDGRLEEFLADPESTGPDSPPSRLRDDATILMSEWSPPSR